MQKKKIRHAFSINGTIYAHAQNAHLTFLIEFFSKRTCHILYLCTNQILLKLVLDAKIKIFAGERPYKCHVPDCGRAFIQLSNLQQHLRNHESQLERLKNRPFHCAICGKGFATESSMRTHNSKVSQVIIISSCTVYDFVNFPLKIIQSLLYLYISWIY